MRRRLRARRLDDELEDGPARPGPAATDAERDGVVFDAALPPLPAMLLTAANARGASARASRRPSTFRRRLTAAETTDARAANVNGAPASAPVCVGRRGARSALHSDDDDAILLVLRAPLFEEPTADETTDGRRRRGR